MATPPTLPPQAVGPLAPPPTPAGLKAHASALLFNKTWWLFFDGLLTYVASLATSTPPTPGPTVLVFDFTLTANLTLTAANTSDPTLQTAGALMAVFLRQDATGGWTTTWNSPPFRGATGGLGVAKNKWSLLTFICQVDPGDGLLKWWLSSEVTNKA